MGLQRLRQLMSRKRPMKPEEVFAHDSAADFTEAEPTEPSHLSFIPVSPRLGSPLD
jgi:hypothetical protein